MENPEIVIKTENLSKTYRTSTGYFKKTHKDTRAVFDVNLEIYRGELFGLVGPNGAGKTTITKMLSTLLLPTTGTASILGFDLIQQTKRIRPRIGFIFGGSRGVYARLSALDNLRYFSELYGIPPEVSGKRISYLIELVGLQGREQERVETYSTGMAQRLQIARMLLHDPELLFLDEPTVGLDPVVAREFRTLIKELTGLGKTILLTSHYMLEIDELCKRVAVINQGEIIMLDSPDALKHRVKQDDVIDLYFADAHYPLAAGVITDLCGRYVTNQTRQNQHQVLSIYNANPQDVFTLIAPLLESRCIQNLQIRQPTLEDAYVEFIKGKTS
jgi:ABC-2 type transport system ATP-binding protein